MSRTQFVANLSAMAPLERDLEQASPSTPVGSIFNLRPSSNEFSWSGQLATPASPAPDHLADAPHRQAFATGMWASDYLLGQVGSKPRFSNGNVWLLPRRWRMAGDRTSTRLNSRHSCAS